MRGYIEHRPEHFLTNRIWILLDFLPPV